MSTRTRSRKQEEAKITDVFKTSRRVTRSASKSNKENISEIKEIQPEIRPKARSRSVSRKKTVIVSSEVEEILKIKDSPKASSSIKEVAPIFVQTKKRAASKARVPSPPPIKLKELPETSENVAIKLSENVQKSRGFDLPNKYENLLKKFHQMDRIVSILDGRGSRCELSNILRNVQKNINLDFTRLQLAQIVAVYAESYNLSLEEQRNLAGNLTGRHDLVLKPNLADDLKTFLKDPLDIDKTVAIKLEGWRMKCRMRIMRHLLAKRVKECHRRFIERLSKEIEADESSFLDPDFLDRINEECDDIEPATLPEPQRKVANSTNVEKFLKSLNNVEAGVKELKIEGAIIPPRKSLPIDSPNAKKPPKISNVKNLLERIRKKEALKKEAEAKCNPEAEHRQFCVELLHSKLLRPLLNLYTLKSSRSIQLAQVLEKMSDSTSRSKGEITDCIKFLCDIVPSYSKIVEVTSNKYLQIEQNAHQTIRDSIKEAFESIKL